jgi:hypothetical protein
MSGQDFVVICQKLCKFAGLNQVYFKHPLAIRRFIPKLRLKDLLPKSPLPNGIIAVKYWPIDSFHKLFDNDELNQSIRDGYLLNDIAFFLEEGLVELWPKQETIIEREARTIRWKNKAVKYDEIVDADYEIPNLPEIVVEREGTSQRRYEYVCRNAFMGVVPQELSNVYLIGYTRPTTGGLNNITEMQCLFTHKMVTDPRFHRNIYDGLEEKIGKYNRHYRFWDRPSRTDHLVYYGLYTEDIAKLMKINLRLSDCRSPRDLAMYFIFPNNAFKYRQSGLYNVEGAKEMVEQIYRNHKGFSVVIHYLLTYALLQLTAYVAVIVAYYRNELSALALPFLLLIVLLNPVTSFVAVNGQHEPPNATGDTDLQGQILDAFDPDRRATMTRPAHRTISLASRPPFRWRAARSAPPSYRHSIAGAGILAGKAGFAVPACTEAIKMPAAAAAVPST